MFSVGEYLTTYILQSTHLPRPIVTGIKDVGLGLIMGLLAYGKMKKQVFFVAPNSRDAYDCVSTGMHFD